MSSNVLIRNVVNYSKVFLIENRFRSGIRLSSNFKAAVLDLNSKESPFKITEVKSAKKLKKGQVCNFFRNFFFLILLFYAYLYFSLWNGDDCLGWSCFTHCVLCARY